MWYGNSAVIIVDFQKEWSMEDSPFYIGRTSIAAKKCSTLIHESFKNSSPVAYTLRYMDRTDDAFSKYKPRSNMVKKLRDERIEQFSRKSWDPFLETYLDDFLFDKGVEHVYIGGIAVNAGVRECAESAYNRDIDVTVVKDCCLAETSEEMQFTLKDLQKYRDIEIRTLRQIIE